MKQTEINIGLLYMYIVGHNIGKSKHPNNETCSHHYYSARKGNIEMSDNPNFIVRVMSDKRNPAQPTIHVGYADSGLTDTPHIRHQFRQSPRLSVKPDFTVFPFWIKMNWKYYSVLKVVTNQNHTLDEEENSRFVKYYKMSTYSWTLPSICYWKGWW